MKRELVYLFGNSLKANMLIGILDFCLSGFFIILIVSNLLAINKIEAKEFGNFQYQKNEIIWKIEDLKDWIIEDENNEVINYQFYIQELENISSEIRKIQK